MRLPLSAWQVVQAKSNGPMRRLNRFSPSASASFSFGCSILAANFMPFDFDATHVAIAPTSLTGAPPAGCGLARKSPVVDALQLLAAPQDARLDVHHAVGIGEVARQLGERAVDLAGTFAEIAALERDRSSGQPASSTGPRRGPHPGSPGSPTDRPSSSCGISRAHVRCRRRIAREPARCQGQLPEPDLQDRQPQSSV